MNDFQIRLDTAEAERRLGRTAETLRAGGMNKAMRRAINRTLAHVRTEIVREIRKIYVVSAGGVSKTITVIKAKSLGKASGGGLSGELRFKGDMSVPPSRANARQGKKGVTVRVLREGGGKRIQPGGDKKILATQKRGLAAVWMAKGFVLARVEGKDRPQILYGPSFMAFFSRPGVMERLRQSSQATLQKRLEHEVAYELGKQGGA